MRIQYYIAVPVGFVARNIYIFLVDKIMKVKHIPNTIYVCFIIEARPRAIKIRPFFRYVLYNKIPSIKHTAMILYLQD